SPRNQSAPRNTPRLLFLPPELPKSHPHLHRIHPRIRHRQPGIRNVQITHIHRPGMFPKDIETEGRPRSEINGRSPARHIMRRKQNSATQLDIRSYMPMPGENPPEVHRIQSRAISRIRWLEDNERRHRIDCQLKLSLEKPRQVLVRHDPSITNSRVPFARIAGPTRNRMSSARPYREFMAAILRAILSD